jgi:hypothetical protein
MLPGPWRSVNEKTRAPVRARVEGRSTKRLPQLDVVKKQEMVAGQSYCRQPFSEFLVVVGECRPAHHSPRGDEGDDVRELAGEIICEYRRLDVPMSHAGPAPGCLF